MKGKKRTRKTKVQKKKTVQRHKRSRNGVRKKTTISKSKTVVRRGNKKNVHETRVKKTRRVKNNKKWQKALFFAFGQFT